MPIYDVRDAACAVDVPGVRHMAPVLLMRDGTYAVCPDLTGDALKVARRWVDICGPDFRAANLDLLDDKKKA
ncbi:hypothetical protein [Gordonia sp. NPDC003376]